MKQHPAFSLARRLTNTLAVAIALCAGCHRPAQRPDPLGLSKWVGPLPSIDFGDTQQRSAAADPLGFLRRCREHYLSTIRDYRCLFHLCEHFDPDAGGEAGAEQEIAVAYREKPYSVHMRWLKNAERATRVSYVAGRWVRRGRETALIVPSGLLGLLAPGGVKCDIHGPDVRAGSRRSIDQFGFKKTLDLIIEYCEMAEGDPRYELRFVGGGELDRRPCYVFERRLPYGDDAGVYPDRLLIVYVDREWLVPTGCFAYADDAGEKPLGTYVTTNTHFNVGLTDADF